MIPDAPLGLPVRCIIRFMASATPAPRAAERSPAVPVHAEPLQAVWERTGGRPGGLTPGEVAGRGGPVAPRAKGTPGAAVLEGLPESLAEPLMLLLIAVAVLS